MSLRSRERHWIIAVGPNRDQFTEHPRGGFVKDPQKAYGYHYKKDAIEAAKDLDRDDVTVRRRGPATTGGVPRDT